MTRRVGLVTPRISFRFHYSLCAANQKHNLKYYAQVLVPENDAEFGADVWIEVVGTTKFSVFGKVLKQKPRAMHAAPIDAVMLAKAENSKASSSSSSSSSPLTASFNSMWPLAAIVLLVAFLTLRFAIATLKTNV
jgi:hypothetical protein